MKILYIAPLSDSSGYSNAARNYVHALKLALKPDDVLKTIHTKIDRFEYPLKDWEQELWLETANNTRDIPNIVKKYAADYDVIVNHTTPELSAIVKDKFNINVSSWETDRINKFWVASLNQMQLSLVSCRANLDAYTQSGVNVPLYYVPLAADINTYKQNYAPLDIKELNNFKFKFYTICQFSKKKALDALLKAYFVEFSGNDDVVLAIKVYINMLFDMNESRIFKEIVDNIKKGMRLDHFPKVLIINENYTDEQIYRLHNTCDAYVLPSRAEGWSITHFDAMGFGKRPIAVNWGGPVEFITKETGALIGYDLQPITGMNHPVKHLYTSYERWAEPNISDLQAEMRTSYNLMATQENKEKYKLLGLQRVEHFSLEKVGNKLYDVIKFEYDNWSTNGRSN